MLRIELLSQIGGCPPATKRLRKTASTNSGLSASAAEHALIHWSGGRSDGSWMPDGRQRDRESVVARSNMASSHLTHLGLGLTCTWARRDICRQKKSNACSFFINLNTIHARCRRAEGREGERKPQLIHSRSISVFRSRERVSNMSATY